MEVKNYELHVFTKGLGYKEVYDNETDLQDRLDYYNEHIKDKNITRIEVIAIMENETFELLQQLNY